ncbi:MAG: CoB--CoM heterodisulfide reductase iron-sulfur subunit B family protein [Peptococcaceae bacterium]|nr:CoB--CoM heterodisulfide reductase iron-sulfur subunit B family protein [Peptococcaceae bacterium]
MKYAYYPGCSLHATAKEFDASSRVVSRSLGIELEEIEDWSCCGATSAHATNHFLSIALPARNLALAARMGLDVAAPCAACYNRLAGANKVMRNDKEMRRKVNDVIGAEYHGEVTVKSLLEVFASVERERISSQVVKPLNNLKIACYYGCLLVRPPAVTGFDDPEQPVTMDRILQICGAETLEWGYKTECCGASLGLSREPVALRLVHDILRMAVDAGADCLACACPLCQSNLDARQEHVNRAFGTKFKVPVFYFTQLIGLAMGISSRDLKVHSHFVDTSKVLQAIG